MKQQSMTKKNKAFWAKSKPQQRVAIAKDVLEGLKSNFYQAYTGKYFRIWELPERIEAVPEKLDEAFSVLKKQKATCQVCGIGACFTSMVNLGNKAKTEDFLNSFSIDCLDAIDDSDMRPLLRKIFSSSQLSLIECAFEVDAGFDDGGADTSVLLRQKARDFGGQFSDETERMKAIMNNIIKNKGTFKP